MDSAALSPQRLALSAWFAAGQQRKSKFTKMDLNTKGSMDIGPIQINPLP